MIEIVIATHGELARGFLDAVNLITGPQENLHYVSLKQGDSFETFQEKMGSFAQEKNEILYLTDLLGASPYNAAAQTISENREKNIVCLTGVNLPILIEALFKREELDVYQLAEYLLTVGKEGITPLMIKKEKVGE